MWEVKNIFSRNFKIICTTNVERIFMNGRIEQIKKTILNSKKENKFKYDEKNRMIINLEIKNDDEFLDKFSKKDYPLVNNDIANYIEKIITSLKFTEKFTLNIHSDCIDENEKIIYDKAIKNFYADKFIYENRKLKKQIKLALILGLIGIAILLLAIFLEYSENSILWMRVFDIVAWVFIWESVDILAFKCSNIRHRQIRYLNLIDMVINYD